MMTKKILFILLIFVPVLLNAQFKQDIPLIKEKYKAHNAVFLEKESTLFLDLKDDKLVASQNVKKQVLILNEHTKAYSNDNIFFSSFSSIHDIKAKTYIPEGDKFKTVEASTFKETHDISNSIFYDDSKLIHFIYPNVKKGAVTSVEYRVDYEKPRFLRKFFFQSHIPILHSKFVIKYHKDITMDYRFFYGEILPFEFSEYKKGKYKYLVWEGKELPELKAGNKNFNILYYSPHVIPIVSEVNQNGKSEAYFGSMEDLYGFYYDNIKDLSTNSDELKAFVNELLQGIEDDDEKAKKILYWVQDNIKYVAFEQGMRGFVPHSAKVVFEKRYGDCKDMTSIIKTMMDYAGLPCYYAWVGTRRLPYTYKELPTVQTDNHMVAAYLNKDSLIVMDGTINHLKFGQVPDHIQGKDILLSINKDEYKIFKLPILLNSHNQIIDSVQIKIDQKTINGKGKRTHMGYNRMEMGYAIYGQTEERLKKKLTKILNKGNNKCTLSNYEVSQLQDREKSIDIDYEFQVENYLRSYDDEIYINLNLEKTYKNFKADTSLSVAPIGNDFHFIKKDVTSIEIPSDYQLKYLPKNSTYSNKHFGFDIVYKKEGNKVIQEKNISFQFLHLPESEFTLWNKMIKQLNKAYRETIVLKHQEN